MRGWPFDAPQDDPHEEELMMGCDYGLSEFCEDPFARDTGCTVNCGLYIKSCENQSLATTARDENVG